MIGAQKFEDVPRGWYFVSEGDFPEVFDRGWPLLFTNQLQVSYLVAACLSISAARFSTSLRIFLSSSIIDYDFLIYAVVFESN